MAARAGSLTIESEGVGREGPSGLAPGSGPAVADRRYRPGLPDFTRQENWLRGNKRTLKRQYAARNWTFVRLLPDIAGYCRVLPRIAA